MRRKQFSALPTALNASTDVYRVAGRSGRTVQSVTLLQRPMRLYPTARLVSVNVCTPDTSQPSRRKCYQRVHGAAAFGSADSRMQVVPSVRSKVGRGTNLARSWITLACALSGTSCRLGCCPATGWSCAATSSSPSSRRMPDSSSSSVEHTVERWAGQGQPCTSPRPTLQNTCVLVLGEPPTWAASALAW